MGIKSGSNTEVQVHAEGNFGVVSHPGHGPVNEDNFLILPELNIVAVSDGLGGHKAGNVASAIVVDTVEAHCLAQIPEAREEDLKGCLAAACQVAHRAIIDRASSAGSLRMGATLVLVYVRDRRAYIAHVGDSRAYIRKGSELTLLTQDHSLVMRLVKAGRITLEEARTHPKKNVITQALGSSVAIVPSVRSIPVEAGNSFLVCSDGFWENVGAEELEEMLKSVTEPGAVCETLAQRALANGADDDVTIAIMDL